MYYYNLRLLENIHTILGKGKLELSEMLYGNTVTLHRRIKSMERITVNELIFICNRLHISITHFFTTNPEEQVLGTRKDYVIPAEDYKEITFDHTQLNTLYGKLRITNIQTKKEFSRIMSISPPSLKFILRGEWEMKIELLLKICNKLGFNLGYFIKDENGTFPTNDLEGIDKNLVHSGYLEWIRMQEKKQNRACEVTGTKECEISKPEQKYAVRKQEWEYSSELFGYFPEIRGVSMQEMLHSIGSTRSASYCKSENIHVFELVNICNTYRLSSKHFIVREEPKIYGKGYYDVEDFMPIRFRPNRIQMLCGEKGILRILQKDWMEQMGISISKFYGWIREKESTMCMKDLIQICNQYHVSPFFFIEDNNRNLEPESIEEMLMKEYALLKEENERLKREIKRLKSE